MSRSNLPAMRSASSLPQTLTVAAVDALVEKFRSRLEEDPAHPLRYSVRQDLAPSTEEKRALCVARDTLARRIEPTTDRLQVEGIITAFLLSYDIGKGPEDLNAEIQDDQFVRALRVSGFDDLDDDLLGGDETRYYPLKAIQAACDRINGSRALLPRNKRFRPHPPELVDEIRAGLTRTRARIHAIERVLNAEVYDAEPERAPLSPEDIRKLIDTALGKLREGDDRPPNEKAIEEQKRSIENRERTEALAHLARRKAEVAAEIAAEEAEAERIATIAAQQVASTPQQPHQ